VQNIVFEDCYIVSWHTDANGRGVIYEYDGVVTPATIDKIFFVRCMFKIGDQDVNGLYGCVTNYAGGAGWLHYIDCIVTTQVDNARFMYGGCGSVEIRGLSMQITKTNFTFLHFGDTTQGGGCGAFRVIGGFWEINNPNTVTAVRIRPAAIQIPCTVIFVGVVFDPNSGTTITLVNNTNTNWRSGGNQVVFKGCTRESTGTIAAGTWNVSSDFKVIVDISRVTFTENIGTIEFNNNNSVTISHGLYSNPTGVWASFNCSGWGSWFWNATSTQLTIQTENNVNATCCWLAKYDP